jgi:oligopeptide transport system substrate-binding protein
MKRVTIALVALILVLVIVFGSLALGFSVFGWGQGPKASPVGEATKVKRGLGELTLLGDDPPTLDPALAGDTTSASYIVEIFSGLVSINRELKVVPDIAERWDISDDGKTYTFYLRPDVKFHNGKEVKASDFKYSMERACDPSTESVVADTYLGDIVGAKDMLNGKASEIKGIQVMDDRTLRIEIDAAKPYFLAKLTYPTAFVVDKANVKSGRGWTDKPNGTGPFKLKQWQRGEKIVLERNENYYGGEVKLKGVNFLLAGGSSMTMYENGEVDITGVGMTDIERVLDPTNPLNKELVVAPELSVGYIGFDCTTPPFDDMKVRQAFNYAIDKEKIIKVVLKDIVEPAEGILPPGMPGYNEDLKGLGYEPVKAKSLIAESKYKDVANFPRITISIPGTGATVPPTSEAIIEMWKANLGVQVEIQQVEWATYLDDLKRHKFQMFEVGWIADYPDPQDFLDLLFHSRSLENNAAYSNPEVDRLLEQARVEKDTAARLRIYQQVEQMIVNDAPWIPLWHGKSYLLVKPYVKGFYPAPMTIPMFKDVYIEPMM